MTVKLSTMANQLSVLADALGSGRRVISLDPSSSATGAAVFECSPTPRLIHAARLTGTPKNGPAYKRIDQIVDQVTGLVSTYKADLALIEITSGKTSGRHGGHGAGLSIYGVAVGAVREALRHQLGRHNVIGIYENDWTKRTSKLDRWNACRYQYPSFSDVWDADKGDYDASDASYLFGWCVQVCEYAAKPPAQSPS